MRAALAEACKVRRSVGSVATMRFRSSSKNQAAVGSDCRSGKKFYAAQVFAEILDDDFVFAEDFFHDQTDLAIAGVGHHHVEVTVDGFQRRQPEIAVEAHDFGDHVANLGEQLAADVFDFVGAQAANFFDHRQRQSEAGRSAAHEERGRDDQRQRNFQREGRARARRALNIDFAVQRVEIGAHDVEADAAAGKFGLYRSRRKSRMEKHFAQIAFGKTIGGFRGYQAAFDRALPHALVIDAAPVVLHFDVNVIAAVISAQADFADFRLARCNAVFAWIRFRARPNCAPDAPADRKSAG